MNLIMVMCLDVLGTPIGQGRITTYGKGRTTHSNAKTLNPWRQDVAAVATKTMQVVDGDFPLLGPVHLRAIFTVAKPKNAPKTRVTYPVTRPDLSHYLRAVEDALGAAGVWKDDSQVVSAEIAKTYPNEHPHALHTPGVRLKIYTIGATP